VRLPTRARLRRGVLTTLTENGMTLIGTGGQVFHLNVSGRLAVEALANGDVAAAVTALRDRYGLSHQRAESDLARLLGQMRAAQLIRTR
jgi:hypothetical protein